MTNAEVKKKNRDYSLFTWCVQNKTDALPIDRGDGIYLYDMEGNRYYDMRSDQVNCNIGKQNPKVIQAMKDQLDKITFGGPQYSTVPKGELSEKLVKHLPDTFGKILYTNAGADAVENALKMARDYTGRRKVISRWRSYHGCTMGAGAATGDPRRWMMDDCTSGTIRTFAPYCYRCPFGKCPEECKLECATHIEEIIQYENPADIAAIIVETVSGSNLMMAPPDGYLKKIREICDRYGILMICDEVMAGFGRTGSFFAFEQFGIVPDMVVMAKGITSGYVPLGAVAVSKEICDYYEDKLLNTGLTYSGHVLACATACAVIDVMEEEKMVENAQKMGDYIGEKLEEMREKHPCVGDARGIGLMRCLELVYNKETRAPMCPFNGGASPVDELVAYMKAHNVFFSYHWNLVLITPPLIVTREQMDEVLPILDEALTILDKYVR